MKLKFSDTTPQRAVTTDDIVFLFKRLMRHAKVNKNGQSIISANFDSVIDNKGNAYTLSIALTPRGK